MKKMTASAFKANCLAVLDEVQAKHQTVVITKRGKAVAKLVPVKTEADEIFGFFAGKGRITGDVVSPALSIEEWGDLACGSKPVAPFVAVGEVKGKRQPGSMKGKLRVGPRFFESLPKSERSRWE